MKVKIYIHSTVRSDVIASKCDKRRYTMFASTPTSEYYVSKSKNMTGWDKWLPRLANLVVNDHVGAGGHAIDVRLALPQPKKRKRTVVSDKQRRMF